MEDRSGGSSRLTLWGWRLARAAWWLITLQLPARWRARRAVRAARDAVAASWFFDAPWYLRRYPDVAAAGVDPALHYALFGARERRSPGPCFDAAWYLERQPDVATASMDALLHYERYGAAEGRAIRAVDEAGAGAFPVAPARRRSSVLPERVAIAVSSRGNFFMSEIARMIEDGFRRLGVAARLFDERTAGALRAAETVVVVAPHEFFVLGDGPRAFELLAGHPGLLLVNTEQRQTPWFATAERYFRAAAAVLDVNAATAAYLAGQGYRAFALPLGFSEYVERTFDGRLSGAHALIEHLPASVRETVPSRYADRPIDVLFVGTSSARRQAFFSRHAAYFAGRTTFIYMPEAERPFRPGEPGTVDAGTFVALARRSKILLNVHRDESPYLEWHRVVTFGLMQRALVITDTCDPDPFLRPDEDYVEGPLDALPALCERALGDCAGAASMAQRAYDRLRTGLRMERCVAQAWARLAGDEAGAASC